MPRRAWYSRADQRSSSPTWPTVPSVGSVEDASRFCQREVRRGNEYDAVILDPPSYGHGPKGEAWSIQRDLLPLLELCGQLTARSRQFVLCTCHTPGIGAAELSAIFLTEFSATVASLLESVRSIWKPLKDEDWASGQFAVAGMMVVKHTGGQTPTNLQNRAAPSCVFAACVSLYITRRMTELITSRQNVRDQSRLPSLRGARQCASRTAF